ncbi:PREDICTED: uncharacterized protein LOC108378055 [Rhagoletis zephyria]|uniref:uncharacterized protein LOC108378055 n=1 Tax=Rhagoletis zephyria TaxID=28612 RepID=UPI0008112FC5|nr:PREDICTED: uncharacterized protein LOC108378055 [Rhagoletis zephyria]XP_036335311.1 uncharacterized protein LOC118745765 [Rhagoletis pomonella]
MTTNLTNKCIFMLFAFLMFQQHAITIFGSYWNKGPLIADGVCAVKNLKLLSLLNLLCNATQTQSRQARDGCYGCFFRAGSIRSGPALISSLNDCARLYIANTSYADCANTLQAMVNETATLPLSTDFSVDPCYSGYCEFVRCVRRVNAQNLISNCYIENLGTRQLTDTLDRIYFYTNVTSCILARTRCSQYNPVSGELQNTLVVPGKLVLRKSPFLNALQILDNGDLRVVSFSTRTNMATEKFCAHFPSVEQAYYGSYVC